MAKNSAIEWTTHTFNLWRGCLKVSAACKNCYAETRSKRFHEDFAGQRIVLSDKGWEDPLKWNREAEGETYSPRVFCASLADVFEDWQGPMVNYKGEKLFVYRDGSWSSQQRSAPESPPRSSLTMNDVRARLFKLIDATPYLDWLLLTKRPENIRSMWPVAYPAHSQDWARTKSESLHRRNVWLGTTAENQRSYDERIEDLYNVQDLCNFLFLSCEPLLGPLKLAIHQYPVDWVIAGGESGPNARPSHPNWFRGLREQCATAGVPFFFKQWGNWQAGSDPNVDGKIMLSDGRIGETPKALGFTPARSVEWNSLAPNVVTNVGKKRSGRFLDGVEHNGFPGGEA